MQELRAEIAAQLRDRLAESRGLEASLRQLRESVLDEDFLSAGPAELAAMRAVVQPLARRLAATARRRRRPNRTGKLDVRRTMRRAIGTGGVPIDPAWHRRNRPRRRSDERSDRRDERELPLERHRRNPSWSGRSNGRWAGPHRLPDRDAS